MCGASLSPPRTASPAEQPLGFDRAPYSAKVREIQLAKAYRFVRRRLKASSASTGGSSGSASRCEPGTDGSRSALGQIAGPAPDWRRLCAKCGHTVKTALTGLAIGDALGMPFEESPLLNRDLLHWHGEFRPGGLIAGRTARLKAGQWTDDTCTARALAMSLLAQGGRYDVNSAARHYVGWYETGDLRGAGAALCLALKRMHEGVPVGQAATPASRGNSPAKRIAPLGIAYSQDLGLAAKLARVDARITHVTPEAIEGAAAVAVAVAAIASGTPKEGLVDAVAPFLGASRVRTLILKTLDSHGKTDPVRVLVSLGTTKRAAETVATAIYSFTSTRSFREAVELAVRAGGKTDTRAAITGALAGTLYGHEQLTTYLSTLEDSSALIDLDDRLNAAAVRLAG